MLIRNPADAVDPPKVDWKPMQVYNVPQTVELIEAVPDTLVLVPTLLAVLCGLRQREICALLAERRSNDRPNLGGYPTMLGYFPDLRLPALGTHYPHHQAGTTPVTTSARSRDPFARQRRPPEGRQRAFGAQQGRDKAGPLQPHHSRNAGGCRQNRRCRAEISNAAAVRVDGTDGE
jgi:hypothetical protein